MNTGHVVINASEFKARCLRLLDDVAATGEPLTILKRGRPVARVLPIRDPGRVFPQQALLGSGSTRGDIIAPPLDVSDWAAERGELE